MLQLDCGHCGCCAVAADKALCRSTCVDVGLTHMERILSLKISPFERFFCFSIVNQIISVLCCHDCNPKNMVAWSNRGFNQLQAKQSRRYSAKGHTNGRDGGCYDFSKFICKAVLTVFLQQLRICDNQGMTSEKPGFPRTSCAGRFAR